MSREINNIFGYYKLSVSEPSRSKLLNICMKYNFIYKNMYITEEGRLCFCCSVFVAWKLREICIIEGIEIIEEGHGGLLFLLRRYKRRYGIALGAIFMFCILFYSSNVVWDIRVEGNNTLTNEDIINLLNNLGLYEGVKQNSFKTDAVEMRAMLKCTDITWMAITRRGTVINVQIREKEVLPVRDTGTKPANLIAACDAQIAALDVYRGKVMVKVGQVVKKGDLLVSGVYDSVTAGYRVTRSQGKIYAHTIKSFDIEIPLTYEEKKYIDEILILKTVKIFENEIKIFKNSGNLVALYDTIENEKELAFSDGEELPINIKNTYALTYEFVTLQRTEEEAGHLAKEKFSQYLTDNFSDAELIDYSSEIEVTGEMLILHCTVHAIENIAVMQEFDI